MEHRRAARRRGIQQSQTASTSESAATMGSSAFADDDIARDAER
jgi:hypothetical protein